MKVFTLQSLTSLDGKVYIVKVEQGYPVSACFHPTESYPEYPFSNPINSDSLNNDVYSAVRRLFIDMCLDRENLGSSKWNPLGDFVKAGETVVLKPNWVSHFVHGKSNDSENILEVLITHTSIIRAVVDYAFIAVGTTGKIIVADSPIQGTDFGLLLERIDIQPLLSFYNEHSVPIEILDLRKIYTRFDKSGKLVEHIQLAGDPQGYTIVKVDQKSMLIDLDEQSSARYRVYDYDAKHMKTAHGPGYHRYLISNTVLNADLVINLPKLKTHIKTGMTAAMKNFVGANGDKSFLPHYRAGAPKEHGDDYAKSNFWRFIKTEYRYTVAHWPNWIRSILSVVGNKLIQYSEGGSAINKASDPYASSGGSWHGNDTAWRMVVDLNTALLYSGKTGELEKNVQRRWLTIVDSVVAGEGNGPLSPTPHRIGYLLGGVNPVELDFVCAHLLGFEWRKLKFISKGYSKLFGKENFNHIKILINGNEIDHFSEITGDKFLPPDGWQGYL